MSRLRLTVLLATACLALAAFATPAAAAPGAYKILLAEVYEAGAKKLGGQLLAFPDVAQVDYVDTGESTPSAAQLAPYDLVVSIGDAGYLDPVAWGDSLADFVDQGGVVAQTAYDNWEGVGASPAGRFASGGYAPFIPGDNPNDVVSLGEFDATSPLMQGVTSLTSNELNTAPALAPGATLVAKWNTGANAVAFKGRVVSITAFIGDDYGPEEWSGDYARLVLNALRTLGLQVLTVNNLNPAGGSVDGTGPIACGAVCTAILFPQTAVALTATPKRHYAFGGFSGSCTGVACALVVDGSETVNADFLRFGFGKVKARNLKRGRAWLLVKAKGRGRLIVFGKKIKKRGKTLRGAGQLALPIIAKGKAAKALRKKGRVKVGVRLAFIPSGGSKSNLSRTLALRKRTG